MISDFERFKEYLMERFLKAHEVPFRSLSAEDPQDAGTAKPLRLL